jgi:hypothetical protein
VAGRRRVGGPTAGAGGEGAGLLGRVQPTQGFCSLAPLVRSSSSLGDAKSSLGDAKSSLGDAESSLRARWVIAKSSLGDAKSSLGDAAKSSLGDAKSSLGDAKSSLVTLRARWVTLRARWVPLCQNWESSPTRTLKADPPQSSRFTPRCPSVVLWTPCSGVEWRVFEPTIRVWRSGTACKQPANLGVEGAEESLSILHDCKPTVRPPPKRLTIWIETCGNV